MSLSLDSAASNRISATERGVAWLCELDFTGGTTYFTNAPVPVTSGGKTYLALGTLINVSNVHESADTNTEQITIALAVANSSFLAQAMADPATYRGKAARLYLQLFDAGFQPDGSSVLRWQGYMDKVNIKRNTAASDGTQGTIELLCSRAGMARSRRAEGLRLTDAQQQSRYPGDIGFRYVRKLLEQPSLWLSKKFQEV